MLHSMGLRDVVVWHFDDKLHPFATSDFREPGLQHLHLAGCTGVTDTGVSWVVDGCHDIVTLSLKGTRVTSSTTE